MSFLIIVKAGESLYEGAGMFVGTADSDLSDNGRKYAHQLGMQFAKINFDKIYSSPLNRAVQTAKIIKLDANKVNVNVNIITEQRLLERDLGKLTGRNIKDAYSTFSETAIKVWSRGYYSTPDEGENLDSVVIRLRGFLNYNIQPLLKKQKNVLLVCHNDVLRAISVIMGKHTKQSIETCEVIDKPFIVRIGKDNDIKIQ